MVKQRRSGHPTGRFLGILLLGLIVFITWNSSIARAAEGEWVGRVESMPASGFIGDWVVQGRAFTTTSNTEFRQDKGAFALGVCVEIEYIGQSSPFQTTKIATKSSDDCGSNPSPTTTTTPNGTSTPAASSTPNPSPSATPSETASVTATPTGAREVNARVEQMPTNGLLGTWMIGGVAYQVDASTRLRQEKGPFVIGACVEVEYNANVTPQTVYKLATKNSDDCTPGGTPSGTPSATATALPVGFEGELFGILQSFPVGLVGEWNIGGMTFTANATTEFQQRNGAFSVGATVKIHFTSDAAGINLAREIETKFDNDDNGNDDDGNGAFEGAEGHAFGTIESLPTENLLGDWLVGGITYTVNADTQLNQTQGDFTVGSKVRVKYFMNSSGQRLARKIAISNGESGTDDSSHFTLFSFVDSMPATGLLGDWWLDNLSFLATNETQFKEDHGRLGLGAYVKVEYFLRNGRPVLHELETHVPPGAGDNLKIGNIQSAGNQATAAGIHNTIWTIGGENYTVTPATDLNDVQGELVIGATALVNSYSAADGSQVATQIRGVTLDQHLYLPIAER